MKNYSKVNRIGDIRVELITHDQGALVSVYHHKNDGNLLLEELEYDSFEGADGEFRMLSSLLRKIAAIHNFV